MSELDDSVSDAFVACAMLDHGILIESSITPMMLEGSASIIFQAMKKFSGIGVSPDFQTLFMDESLYAQKDFLLRLQDIVASSVNWQFYEKQIIENFTQKKLKNLGKILTEGKGSTSDLTNIIEKTLLEVGNVISKNEIVPIEAGLDDWVERLKNRIALKGRLPGFSWGFKEIDSCTLGAAKGSLVTIGGRPSEGKTAIALQMMRKQAYSEKIKVGFISIESSTMEIMDRFMAGGVPLDGMKIGMGYVTPVNLADIRNFISKTSENKEMIYIYDRPGITIQELRSAARRMVLNYGVQIIYVDYLQLIHVPKADNKIAEVGYASVALKEIARELNICVVVLAQLKRDEKNARPNMGSIQWASAVEQTSDQIWLLYHKKDGDKIVESKIILEKVRDGVTRDIPVRFDKSIVSFFEIAEDER